jgi:hypothetical protein
MTGIYDFTRLEQYLLIEKSPEDVKNMLISIKNHLESLQKKTYRPDADVFQEFLTDLADLFDLLPVNSDNDSENL